MTRSAALMLPCLILGVMLAACGGDSLSTLPPTTAPTSSTATSAAVTSETTAPASPTVTSAAVTSEAPAPTSPTTVTSTTAAQTTVTYPWQIHAVPATPRCVIDHQPGDDLNVRTGPSTDYEVIGNLPHDATGVMATGIAADDDSDREWIEITLGDRAGWTAGWLLTAAECIESAPSDFCVVETTCTDRLNVRTGPGGTYPRVGSLAHDTVDVAGTGWASTDDADRMWIQIEWGSGVAWAAGWFLTDEPCIPWPGDPCICPANGTYFSLVHSVDHIGRFVEYDPIQWVWVGPADTEYIWENPDQTVLRLPIDNTATVRACPPGNLLYCEGPGFIPYTLTDLAQWIEDGTEIGQNQRYAGEIPGHTGQLWLVELSGCSVIEISGIWFP